MSARPPFVLRGRHVLWGVLGFFAVVVGLDALFVTWAVQSYPGEVSERAYEDGLAYNRTLAARRAQASLGWGAVVRQGGRPGEISAVFTGADDEPLQGLRVTAAFARPATDAGARSLALAPTADGAYAGAAPLEPGAWNLTLQAVDAQGRRFEAERRLVWR